MNTTSTSPAEGLAPPPQVRVWDAPVRVFHWLAVLCFAGAYLTAESERWRLVHVTLGYTLGGLVGFRIVWGLVGTRYARFAQFVRGPGAVVAHLKGMFAARGAHRPGHNPAGAAAIVLMLGLALAITASGWALYNDVGGKWVEEAHEIVANSMLAVVGVHIAGVVLASFLQHTNLVRGMVTGRLPGRPEDGIRSAWRALAVLMVAAVLGFWWVQWQSAPAPGALGDRPAASARDDD